MAEPAPKLDPRGRKVKILATVGPASRSPEMLARLFKAGVDAATLARLRRHRALRPATVGHASTRKPAA